MFMRLQRHPISNCKFCWFNLVQTPAADVSQPSGLSSACMARSLRAGCGQHVETGHFASVLHNMRRSGSGDSTFKEQQSCMSEAYYRLNAFIQQLDPSLANNPPAAAGLYYLSLNLCAKTGHVPREAFDANLDLHFRMETSTDNEAIQSQMICSAVGCSHLYISGCQLGGHVAHTNHWRLKV